MSRDDGIYILKTKEGQHRVIWAQAIDNLWWSYIDFNYNREMTTTRIVEFFGKSKFTKNAAKALEIAEKMETKYGRTEYGIRILTVHKTWNRIVTEAKKLARLEIDSILNSKHLNKLNYEIKELEKISDMKNYRKEAMK